MGGEYVCGVCGTTSDTAGDCCGKPMKKKESSEETYRCGCCG